MFPFKLNVEIVNKTSYFHDLPSASGSFYTISHESKTHGSSPLMPAFVNNCYLYTISWWSFLKNFFT